MADDNRIPDRTDAPGKDRWAHLRDDTCPHGILRGMLTCPVCDPEAQAAAEASARAMLAPVREDNRTPAPPAPRAWFPGDTVPAGTRGVDRDGWIHGDLKQPWVLHHGVKGGALVEIFEPSREEWQAAVDRATAERDSATQLSEGTNP